MFKSLFPPPPITKKAEDDNIYIRKNKEYKLMSDNDKLIKKFNTNKEYIIWKPLNENFSEDDLIFAGKYIKEIHDDQQIHAPNQYKFNNYTTKYTHTFEDDNQINDNNIIKFYEEINTEIDKSDIKNATNLLKKNNIQTNIRRSIQIQRDIINYYQDEKQTKYTGYTVDRHGDRTSHYNLKTWEGKSIDNEIQKAENEIKLLEEELDKYKGGKLRKTYRRKNKKNSTNKNKKTTKKNKKTNKNRRR